MVRKSMVVVPEGGGGQQPGGLAVVVHVGDGADGVGHLVVHDGVHVNRNGILGQNLEKERTMAN